MSRIIIAIIAILNVWSAQSQIDREFWFVAPEANQNHGDRPIYLKFATYSEPGANRRTLCYRPRRRFNVPGS